MNTPLPPSQDETTLRALLERTRHIAFYRVKFDLTGPHLGRVLMVSDCLTEIVGIDHPEEFSNWFANLHPEDRARIEAASRRSALEGVPYNETARFWHPGRGKWVWVHTISQPHYAAGGAIAWFDGMVVDITDQMELREAGPQSRAAEGLREMIRVINSNRSQKEILDLIARHACELLEADSTMIRIHDESRDVVYTVTGYNLPEEYLAIPEMPFYRTEYDQHLIDRRPYFIADVQEEFAGDLAIDPWPYSAGQRMMVEADLKHCQSILKAPVFIKDRLYGAITFHYTKKRGFTEEDLHLAMTVGDHAALAIENARLIAQVRETAVVEERSRLARELHDAVTQTLFSTTLIADVLPVLWERQPDEALRRLEELRRLTRGALAEMRTLLLELRPAALADTDLCDLLRHLCNAFIGRARVPVELDLRGGCEIPLEVKITCYRIAQEALNNVAKHAEASRVWLTMHACPGGVEMEIRDDGQGFSPGSLPPDHLGLGIMRERAAQIGAALDVTSSPGKGTRVNFHWSMAEGAGAPHQRMAQEAK